MLYTATILGASRDSSEGEPHTKILSLLRLTCDIDLMSEKVTGDDVNVRKGPGVDYASLGVFFKGDKVRIVDSNRNALNETWYKIEYDNPKAGLIVGWVRSDFINIK